MEIVDVFRNRPLITSVISRDSEWLVVAFEEYDSEAEDTFIRTFVRPASCERDWVEVKAADKPLGGPSIAPDCRRMSGIRWEEGEERVHVVFLDSSEEAFELPETPKGAQVLKWCGKPGRPTCLAIDSTGSQRAWIWLQDDAGPTPITPEGTDVRDYSFSVETGRLAFSEIVVNPPARVSRLYIGDDSGEGGASWVLPFADLCYLTWSPDGQWLSFLAPDPNTLLSHKRLWILDPSNPLETCIALATDIDGQITGYDWLPGGEELLVAYAQGTVGRLFRIRLDGTSDVEGEEGVYLSAPRTDRSTGRYIFLRQTGSCPQELWLREPGEEPARCSDFNPSPLEGEYGDYRIHTWKTTDGLTLEGVFLAPEGNGPWPTIVWLHGGPAEHMSQTFSPYFQYYRSKGWAVFCPNYRGSTGRDLDFLRSNTGKLTVVDSQDVIGGVTTLQERGLTGEEVGVVGWSYGATLALRLVAQSDLFKAAICGAPVTDWVHIYGAPFFPFLTRSYFGGAPWKNRERYDRASPVTYVEEISTPCLFLHGADDLAVPLSHSVLMHRGLRENGVATDLRVFPDEGHVFKHPMSVKEMLVRTLEWLGAHADPKEEAAPEVVVAPA